MTPQEFALIMAFSADNPEESRAIFNQARDAAEAAGDLDQAAKFELVREYALQSRVSQQVSGLRFQCHPLT